jgi:hypothetical protein
MNCFGQCLKVVKEKSIEENIKKFENCFEQCRQIEERIKKLEEEFHGIKVEISDHPEESNPEKSNPEN